MSMGFENRMVRGSAIFLGLVLLLLFLWKLGFVLLLVFAAVLVGILLRSLADRVSEWTSLGPGLSLAVVLVAIIAIAAGLGVLVAPQIASQFRELGDVLPRSWQRMQEYISGLPFGDQIVRKAENGGFITGGAVESNLPRFFSLTVAGVIQFAFVIVTGIYLAADPQRYVQGLLKLVPVGRRARTCEMLGAAGYVLERWLVGQALIMTFVGVGTATGLTLLGVPLALSLGLIAGLLDFVPNVGPIVAAIPAILIALMTSPKLALWVMLMYFVVQHIEGYVLTPLVHRKTVSLEPALIITAQLAFGLTVGTLGVLLATPLVAFGMVAVKMLYVEDVLGDNADVEGADQRACTVESRP